MLSGGSARRNTVTLPPPITGGGWHSTCTPGQATTASEPRPGPAAEPAAEDRSRRRRCIVCCVHSLTHPATPAGTHVEDSDCVGGALARSCSGADLRRQPGVPRRVRRFGASRRTAGNNLPPFLSCAHRCVSEFGPALQVPQCTPQSPPKSHRCRFQ